MRYLLSVDCGLTTGKTAVFNEHGEKLAEGSITTPLNGLEMDAESLWEGMAACIRDTISQSAVNPKQIAAIGLSGHGNGLYAFDREMKPLAAISSMYDLNQFQIDEFRTSEEKYGRFYELTGQSCWGGQPLQILRHMKLCDPDRYAQIHCFCCCKDYIRWKLSGVSGTDYSDFNTSALAMGQDGLELCDLLDIPEMATRFPKPARCDEVVGCVTALAAAETGLATGTPVVAGGIDLFACMLGTGITNEGICSMTAGTWGIAAAYANDITDAGQLTQQCRFLPDSMPVGIVSSPTSCVNLEWFIKSVRPELTYDEANRIALDFSPDHIRIIYVPYIYRDMAKPHVDCAFRCLSASDTWREMLRAVFEGVCFSHRLQIERLERAGISVQRARLSGGASKSVAWRKLLSDILNLPIEIPEEKQAGLLGAAMMAAKGISLFPSLELAAEHMGRVEDVQMPQSNGAYDEKYQQFKRLVGE